MNVPMLSNEKEKAVKEEVSLCVQLNSKEKVNNLYLVRTQSIKTKMWLSSEVEPKRRYSWEAVTFKLM